MAGRVTSLRSVSAALLTLAILAGTLADRPRPHPPLMIGGYRVLLVDFHTHSSMWSDGALTPWGLVIEAERQGLDAIAITGHNQVLDGKVGHWFTQVVGGPTVLMGEEVLSGPSYHLIAVGITERVGFRQSAASAIDEIHRQGGIAIAAHPLEGARAGYDDAAMHVLDGAEICHPLIYARDGAQRELEEFAARAPMAAIGSSDFHGLGQMGLCRTFVFATDVSERSILDAVRAHRTLVYGRDGRAYGDPALMRLADDPRLRQLAAPNARGRRLDWLSRIAGLAGLAGVIALAGRPPVTVR
jgi:predicted metal-dependent phosphoesterase TrpH